MFWFTASRTRPLWICLCGHQKFTTSLPLVGGLFSLIIRPPQCFEVNWNNFLVLFLSVLHINTRLKLCRRQSLSFYSFRPPCVMFSWFPSAERISVQENTLPVQSYWLETVFQDLLTWSALSRPPSCTEGGPAGTPTPQVAQTGTEKRSTGTLITNQTLHHCRGYRPRLLTGSGYIKSLLKTFSFYCVYSELMSF